jgi:hypothetical protein
MNNIDKNTEFMSDKFWREYDKRQTQLDGKLTRIDSGKINVNALTESISLYSELLKWIRENTEISEEIRAQLLENNRHVFERLNGLNPKTQPEKSNGAGVNVSTKAALEMPTKSNFQ